MPPLSDSPAESVCGGVPLVVEPAPRSYAALAIAILLPVLAAFSPRDLWAPDEPRYAVVAREMLANGVAHGGAVVPRLAGEAYAEKPPLGFVAMAAAGVGTGRLSAVAVRLPCALLAALAVLMTARLARRWFGDAGLGDTAALVFSTTALVLWNGPRATLDLPMTALALVALDAGTTVVAKRSIAAALGCGAALGAAILVKGPHALLVVAAALVGGCVAAREARRLADPRWLAALGVAAAMVLAWLLPAIARAGDEVAYNSDLTYRQRLLGQLGSRIAGESEPHDHAPFFLVPLLLAVALPWTPAWLVMLPRGIRASRAPAEDRFGLGAAAWGLLAPLLLISLPATQRDVYLIPLLPCAAILGAYAIHRATAGPAALALSRWIVVFLAVVAVLGFALPIAAGAGARLLGDDAALVAQIAAEGHVAFACGAAAFLAAAGAAVAWRIHVFAQREAAAGKAAGITSPSRLPGVARAAGIALAAAWLVVSTSVLPQFDRWKSFAAAGEIAAREAPAAPLSIWGFSDASVLWSFPHRALVRLGEVGYPEAAAALAPGAPKAIVLAREKVWRERDRRATPEQRAVFDQARVLWRSPTSGTPYVLLTNGTP